MRTETGNDLGAIEKAATYGKVVAAGFEPLIFVGVVGHGELQRDQRTANCSLIWTCGEISIGKDHSGFGYAGDGSRVFTHGQL